MAQSGLRLTLAPQQRLRIARKAPDRAQRHVAHNSRNTKLGIVDQAVGELLIAGKVGANKTRHVIDGAAHLPALDDLLDCGEALLKIALARLLLKDDFGEDGDRLGKFGDIDQCLIADDRAGSFKPANALEAGTCRQARSCGQLLNGLAPVALQRGQDLDVDPVERRSSLRAHGNLQPSESSLTATV